MDKTVTLQNAKKLITDFHTDLIAADHSDVPRVMNRFCASEMMWRGFHPFDEITTPAQVAERFWQPLKRSLSAMQNRVDIFFAGQNSLRDKPEVWVVSMGHLMGLFDQPWLGIRPTGKMAFLRYCAFYKVSGDQIVDTAWPGRRGGPAHLIRQPSPGRLRETHLRAAQ